MYMLCLVVLLRKTIDCVHTSSLNAFKILINVSFPHVLWCTTVVSHFQEHSRALLMASNPFLFLCYIHVLVQVMYLVLYWFEVNTCDYFMFCLFEIDFLDYFVTMTWLWRVLFMIDRRTKQTRSSCSSIISLICSENYAM